MGVISRSVVDSSTLGCAAPGSGFGRTDPQAVSTATGVTPRTVRRDTCRTADRYAPGCSALRPSGAGPPAHHIRSEMFLSLLRGGRVVGLGSLSGARPDVGAARMRGFAVGRGQGYQPRQVARSLPSAS